MRSPREDAEGGFMLVELLVVISLMAIVGGLLSDAIVSAFHSQRDITARATDLNSLRQAMERTTRDMRAADAVCPLTQTQTLQLEAPAVGGGTTLFTWSIATANGVSSLVESQSPDANCQATGAATTSTTLVNLDPATTLFSYTQKPGYHPAVPEDGFCTVIATGKIEPRCVGVVGVDLAALLPGHPDIEISETVQLRNVT